MFIIHASFDLFQGKALFKYLLLLFLQDFLVILENIEKMFPRYYMHISICLSCSDFQTLNMCVTRREQVELRLFVMLLLLLKAFTFTLIKK